MTMISHHNTPSQILLHDLMAKVNALGGEPRILVELDKYSYVPGMKTKLQVTEWLLKNSVRHVQANAYSQGEEPADEEVEARREHIKCAAVEASEQWGLGENAVRFLMAVAKHETGYGTLGKGVKKKGSFILGYGCPSACDHTYAGISTQMYYGAKRFKEALGSRLNKIKETGMTKADVDYFHDGGDKGSAYVWSADGTNWKSKVWQYYQELAGESMTCNKMQTMKVASLSTMIAPMSVDTTKPVFPIQGKKLGTGSGDATVTSHSGKQNPKRPNHKGIDLAINGGSSATYGLPVVAAWAGTVVKSYTSSSYGECVVIRHANGWETLYAHLVKGSRVVSEGQKVTAGQVIGKLGNTGNVVPKPSPSNPHAGSHLHFEIWKDGWVYGGNKWIDPYPVLTGAQTTSAGGITHSGDGYGGGAELEIIENVKFEKCFNNNGNLTEDFVGVDGVSWFAVPKLGQKFIGYKKGTVQAGDSKSFAYRHDFSADGYFEYSLYLDLQLGDTLTVMVNGIATEIYTHEDNSDKVTFAKPIYVRYMNVSQAGANSNIIDFHLQSNSGQAEFGIACLKVAEVEVINGVTMLDVEYTQRIVDRYFDIGAFMYSDTFYLEDDILEWEINTHFDMQSSTARIKLNNHKGIYSPSYERVPTFPDNLEESPYSWYENGKLQHILSEETPVRIYAGYGENLVRVFTGKIKGEIEENSAERTITFTCVDKYDELEEYVFFRPMNYPPEDEVTGHTEEEPKVMWLKSSIVQNIVREAGLTGWRHHMDDLRYPDFIVEETIYIDIDKGERKAIKLDSQGNAEEVVIDSEMTVGGYKNPYVETAKFDIGVRASDAISQLIAGTFYHARCDRYGTFLLYRIPTKGNIKWEFVDDDNLYSLDSSIDHSRVRNHIMIMGAEGTEGKVEHFFDRDLLIALKGAVRTAGVQLDWVDERYGSNARGQKEEVAKRLFFDMKRQARTRNVIVKGNPMIDILDGCYIYDRNTSTEGYFLIKGNRLVGNKEGMLNFLELTWENITEE